MGQLEANVKLPEQVKGLCKEIVELVRRIESDSLRRSVTQDVIRQMAVETPNTGKYIDDRLLAVGLLQGAGQLLTEEISRELLTKEE